MAIFRFRIPSRAARREPLATQKAAAAWLRRLPRTDAIERQQTVTRAIEDAFRSAGELRFEQVGAIEFLDAELAADRGRFITQYVEHAEGTAALVNRIWQAAYDSCQGFILAYRSLLDRAQSAANEPRWMRAFPRLAARLIHFYGIDAELRVLKNEAWIPAKWMDLHRIYKRAVDLRVERAQPGPDPSGSGALQPTVEQEYVAVLLTHLFNTGTLAPREIDWAAAELRTWATGLRLDDAPRTLGGFVVDVGGRRGLERRRENESGLMLRYLDTGSLSEQIDRAVADLRRWVAPDVEGAEPGGAQRIAMLGRLRPLVSPDPRSAVAREPRAKVGLSVQMRIGLPRICQELAPGNMHDAPTEHAAGVKPHAVAADELERSHPPVGAFAGAPLPGERPWHVADRSDTGIRIVASAALGQNPTLGMLVAVRDAGEGTWLLGVVRRVARPSLEKIEAGVSIIASHPIPVALHAKCHAREEMGFVVDGVDVSTVGERFDGLYLPPASRPDRATAKTLVIPSSEYAEGRHIILITPRTVYTVALREPLERHPGWTWVAIEIIGQTARD
jgi:hypothetical protein